MKLSQPAKVGLFSLAALIALVSIITWKSNLFLYNNGVDMMGAFKNIEGLTVGSEVRYRGFNVGKVVKIDPGPKDIKVYAIVTKGLQMPADSELRVGFDGLVGLKYLEIKPGISEVLYTEGQPLNGVSTAGIVDFVDIGAQNLVETKKILMTLRSIIEDPALQKAFKDAVFTADNATQDIQSLVEELRQTNSGIMKITTDKDFQTSVKGTVKETNKTLKSANDFFESFGKLNIRPSADIQYGSVQNSVRGNVDIVQSPANYLRIGLGEGPTRNLSLLDVLLSHRLEPNVGMRLGMINTYLGGGVDLFADKFMFSGDIYDFNNPKPKSPKFRATAYYKFYEFGNLFVQADDFLNVERNYSIGIRIKGYSGDE